MPRDALKFQIAFWALKPTSTEKGDNKIKKGTKNGLN